MLLIPKGIDSPLLEHLEAVNTRTRDEKKRIAGCLIAKAQDQIEQSHFALFASAQIDDNKTFILEFSRSACQFHQGK